MTAVSLYCYRATVVRVVDGDTVDVDMDLGLSVTRRERLRLYGIDAPEVRGEQREEGKKAKAWLQERLPVGKEIVVETVKDKQGKFGRYLAGIYDGETCLNDEMVAAGMAVVWEY